MSEALLYQQEGHVVTLTLNKHETRNAISEDEMVDAIVAACSRINADNSVRVAIITGAGSAFSSGGNVKDMRDKTGMFGGTGTEIRDGYRNGIQRIPLAIQQLEVPIIAAVNGAAIGAGCDFYFEYFKFAPQIKYSYGLTNLIVQDGTVFTSPLEGFYSRGLQFSITFE